MNVDQETSKMIAPNNKMSTIAGTVFEICRLDRRASVDHFAHDWHHGWNVSGLRVNPRLFRE